MWKRLPILAVIGLLVVLVAPPCEADKDDKKDHDWIAFEILDDGESVGEFGFKTVASATGTIFTSSKLEMKVKKGMLSIQTHVERSSDGTIEKYRKWVGKKGAKPALIAFPYEGKLRVVSKGKVKFSRDLVPPEGTLLLDRMGFHLYAEMAQQFRDAGSGIYPCLLVHKGEMGEVWLTEVGTANLTNARGEAVSAKLVEVKASGFNLSLFVGDKPIYLGFQSKSITLLREGWKLKDIVPLETLNPPDPTIDGGDPLDGTTKPPPDDDGTVPTDEEEDDAVDEGPTADNTPLPPLPE